MKERIKSFFVFTSTGYRILAFLVLPVFGIVLGHLVAFLLAIPGYFVTIYTLAFLDGTIFISALRARIALMAVITRSMLSA